MSESKHERSGPDFEAVSARASGLTDETRNLVQRADGGDVKGIRTAVRGIRATLDEIERLLGEGEREQRSVEGH